MEQGKVVCTGERRAAPTGCQSGHPMAGRIGTGVAVCVLALAALLTGAGLAWAQTQTVVVIRNWARVHAAPRDSSRTVAIVYGNDVLQVLRTQEGWMLVRARGKVRGWISAQDVAQQEAQPATPPAVPPAPPTSDTAEQGNPALPMPPPDQMAKRMGTPVQSAESLQRLGYRDQAREKLVDVLSHERDTPTAYEATRALLAYYPVGTLPPLVNGKVPANAAIDGRRLATTVLLEEAKLRVQHGDDLSAVSLVQQMLRLNPQDGQAYLGLLDTLNASMAHALTQPNLDNLGVAISIYRQYYPDLPLPIAVQERLKKANVPQGAAPDAAPAVAQQVLPRPEASPASPTAAQPAASAAAPAAAAPAPARHLSAEETALQKAASQAESGHFLDAVSDYQQLLKRNPHDGQAFLGLLDTLNAFMADALAAPNQANLSVAVSTYRQYFPTLPLPRDVQAKLQSVAQ
ncbi:MAG TPA: SH3 domain-containing protein [bacterium]|nr:SH3 domain-containing protein [bacterium]